MKMTLLEEKMREIFRTINIVYSNLKMHMFAYDGAQKRVS